MNAEGTKELILVLYFEMLMIICFGQGVCLCRPCQFCCVFIITIFLAGLFRRKAQAIVITRSSSVCKNFEIVYNFVIPLPIHFIFTHFVPCCKGFQTLWPHLTLTFGWHWPLEKMCQNSWAFGPRGGSCYLLYPPPPS